MRLLPRLEHERKSGVIFGQLFFSISLSRQILREYLATMTRAGTFTKELQRELIFEAVRNFEKDFVVLDERANVTEKLLELAGRIAVGGKQIHDASIVATMLVNDIPKFLTHNVSDFKRFQPEIKLVPLLKDD